MARTAKKINIKETRKFTNRNEVSNWLPSIGGNFVNTFTLKGENDDKSSSLGEINKNTVFGKGIDPLGKFYDNISVLEPNLNKFYLSMHCLKHNPYSNPSLFGPVDDKTDDILFTGDLSSFYFNYQTGVGSNSIVSRGLTCDAVRYYRKDKSKNLSADNIKNEKIFTQLIKYSQESSDYRTNVAGVLGRVTYDSVVKHTLYNLLLANGLVPDKEKQSVSWTQEAEKLKDKPDIYVDVGGGPYTRAFPVAIFIVKDKKGKKINDLIGKANDLAGSVFSRKLNNKDQLVTPIGDKEQNFISIPIRDTGDSVYCIIYDLIKILVLPPISQANFMIDLLKIGVSFLTKMPTREYTKGTLRQEIILIKDYLTKNFENLSDTYNIRFQKKHTIEASFTSNIAQTSLTPIISTNFGADIKNLCKSLENVYEQLLNTLPNSFTLHFDNFYNLLAITSKKDLQAPGFRTYPEDVPFDLKQYETATSDTDLLPKFFKNSDTLPKDYYSFTPEYALNYNINLITNVFIKQLYSILDQSSTGFFYDSDENSIVDGVKTQNTINLLQLINNRTKYNLNKEEYFTLINNKPTLKFEPPGIRVLDISSLAILFESINNNYIKFQTLNHFLYLDRISNPDQDTFKDIIYYPRLEQVQPTPKKKEDEIPPPKPRGGGGDKGKENKDRDFLINNIISSELACYEDIADSFDKAINAEKPNDKVYFAWQTVSNIGLPILLATVSQMIAAKINELSKQGDTIDPDLAACVARDSEKIKKTIIGYADLLSNLENPEQLLGILVQEIPDIPKIPNFQYLLTFDAEKELKRKVVEYLINQTLKVVKFQLGAVLKAFVDICNADSYLTGFLDSAFNSSKDETNKKLSTPTPSGLPVGNMSPVYVPESLLNINQLIEESAIETKQNVYEFFRLRFFVTREKFPDQEISTFFDKLSSLIDSGEMSMLLKGTSSLETRNLIVSFITNYNIGASKGDFSVIINNEEGVSLLFSFLSEYINYRLCYEKINSSLLNFTPTVCFDLNSRYNDNINYFTEDEIDDQIADLTKTLDDICKNKLPDQFDIFSGGPTLLTTKFIKIIVDSISTAINPPISTSTNNVDQTPIEISTIYELYKTTELNSTLKRIENLKERSALILKTIFNIAESYNSFSFINTNKIGQTYYQTTPNVTQNKFYYWLYEKDKIPDSYFYQQNKIIYEDFNIPSELFKFSYEFLKPILWENKEEQQYSKDEAEKREKDNEITLKYFNKKIKVPQHVNDMWNTKVDNYPIFVTETFNYNKLEDINKSNKIYSAKNIEGWAFEIYNYVNYNKDFINSVLSPINVEDDKFIKESFQKVQANPTLNEMFKFAVELYDKAFNLELNFIGESTNEIENNIEPWLQLDAKYLKNFEYKKTYTDQDIKDRVNNLGNYGLKTEDGAVSGYLEKYQLYRNTKTKIYNSKFPGELPEGQIKSFIEE